MGKLLRHLSFHGRANRQRYWLTSLAIIVIFLVCAMLTAIPVVGVVAAGIGFLAALVASFAVSARRLHDRAKSAWWLALIYVPITVLSGLSGAMEATEPSAAAGLNALSLPFSIWAFIELGCLKGTVGPNRFGPDPLKPSLVEVFS